jgi:bacterial leucyl aminopeptidase
MEGFRAMLAAGFTPTNPVEFHWYSAEEVGLLGSQDIAVSYKKAGKKVKAFLQLDMTAYFSGNEVIALESVSAWALTVFKYVNDPLRTTLMET